MTPSRDGDANLLAEGVCIGNIMLDSFEMLRAKITSADTRERLRLSGPFAVVTLHRPSNVDERAKLTELTLAEVSQVLPVVFTVHPRTRKRLEESVCGRHWPPPPHPPAAAP